ncbi:endonuclease/exonuclease/phosphatase family protein [Microlunatus parietis]|uniref:Endonuclease/exonuclease/phosphatase family metal-dependent hydrolase n=1 Tax=Microlunatus parietis TaxID=682979 RepID=A0A7Y9LEP2_9ACTN|nr:endonuclease/exonuclease/phosphatase family protein [Microlunatus parietis]NYE73246.1 endonuclease/exonuclease/phosphatase family metal-dependent hydrolase [Microlunatus parietis]
MRRSLRIALAFLAALFLIPATASADDGRDHDIDVISYNIHHGRGVDGVLDLERIARLIEDSGADVVALQEVDRHFGDRSDWVDQPAWFADRLRMHVSYGANLDLEPLTPGAPRRQYGTALLSRFPIVESSNTYLPKYPGQEQRGLLQATLAVHGQSVRVANTHLTHNNNAERQEQADAVRQLLSGSRRPTVLAGDLNARPDVPEIKTLTAVLRDGWVGAGAGPGYTYPVAAPASRIDYLLHSGNVITRSIEVPHSPASDHLPVVARMRVPAGA